MDTAHFDMVDAQLMQRGIKDPRVLRAFLQVPREKFVEPDQQPHAFDDSPLPIGGGQTISQPYIVALMAEAMRLSGSERVLEIGTGSGYAAAIFARLSGQVFSIERDGRLARAAQQRLEALGQRNVHLLHADGALGWAEHAPFDAIAVAARSRTVPRALLSQLAIGGRLVIPLGGQTRQILTRVTRLSDEGFQHEPLLDVRFVPLVPGRIRSEAVNPQG